MVGVKVTLREVAARAGVSEATASKAINGRGEIADRTRTAVLDAAAALGYVPGRRQEAGSARPTIVAITDAIDPYYGVEILRGLVEEGALRGVDIIPHIESASRSPESPNEWEDLHLGSRPIGIVTIVYRGRGPVFQVARRRGIPVVAIDPYDISKGADITISSSNWEGGKTATEHLIGLGHRRIALINGLPDFAPGAERMHGYRAALEEAGIGVSSDLVFDGQYTFGSGFDAAERILQLSIPPTAVFALSDRMALGAIRAFETHGVRVPGDISVVGFDNSPGTELMTPALTTIGQPLTDMGRLAVRTIKDMSVGHPPTSSRITLATGLVVRSSTATPRG